MEVIKPVNTSLGEIYGRDAVSLNSLEFINETTIKLKGNFNGDLCDKINQDKNFEIVFQGIISLKVLEIDFDPKPYTSSFDYIENSTELKKLIKIDKEEFINKINDSFRHYIFRTYDSCFEIIAKDFNLFLH